MKCKHFERRRVFISSVSTEQLVREWDKIGKDAKLHAERFAKALNSGSGVSGGYAVANSGGAMHAGLANQYAPGSFVPAHDYPRPRPWWKFWGA